jgi:hypothetical protein
MSGRYERAVPIARIKGQRNSAAKGANRTWRRLDLDIQRHQAVHISTNQRLKGSEKQSRRGMLIGRAVACARVMAPVPLRLSFSGRSGCMIAGSMVALVTPMDAQGRLDWDALSKLVDFHLQEGTNAIVAVGTTGESATLDVNEHIK